jgi:hypothetical protein
VDVSLHEPFLEEIAVVYAEVKAVLDERQRRLVLGAAARRLGRGGIKKVAAAVGVDPDTVSQGVKDVAAGPVVEARVRAVGAGRPPVTVAAPGVSEALEQLVEPVTRGDPQSPLRWTNKSTQKLADELSGQGFTWGRARWPSCSRRAGTGCRPTRRWWKAASIQTGMPSSSMSTRRRWRS